MTPRSLIACALAVGTLAACSGGGSSAPTTVVATTTTEAATTAAPSTEASTTTSTTIEATTTTQAGPRSPLTGQVAADPKTVDRPALVVKVDNHSQAWPQSGINEADVVFEELVEGISRLAVVFQSRDALDVLGAGPKVGPIRSARTSDIAIIAALGKPLLAWSGGNPGVVGAVHRANLVDVGANAAYGPGGYYRERGRAAPHNLFANSAALHSLIQFGQPPANQLFAYREDGAPSIVGEPTGGVRLAFEGNFVQYTWDATKQGWLRSQQQAPKGLQPHKDAQGVQVAPANVVVMFCAYRPSPADPKSPEAQTVGKGDVWVFTDGKLVTGTWVRPDARQPAKLLDANGAEIALTPGQTWVELPKPGQGAQIGAGADPASVPWP